MTSASGRTDTRRLPVGSFHFFRLLRKRSPDAPTKIAADLFAAIRKRAAERNHQRLPHLTQPGRRPWLSSYSVFAGSPRGRSCLMGKTKATNFLGCSPLFYYAVLIVWFNDYFGKSRMLIIQIFHHTIRISYSSFRIIYKAYQFFAIRMNFVSVNINNQLITQFLIR